jgi:hypothetical protein
MWSLRTYNYQTLFGLWIVIGTLWCIAMRIKENIMVPMDFWAEVAVVVCVPLSGSAFIGHTSGVKEILISMTAAPLFAWTILLISSNHFGYSNTWMTFKGTFIHWTVGEHLIDYWLYNRNKSTMLCCSWKVIPLVLNSLPICQIDVPTQWVRQFRGLASIYAGTQLHTTWPYNTFLYY